MKNIKLSLMLLLLMACSGKKERLRDLIEQGNEALSENEFHTTFEIYTRSLKIREAYV